MVRHVDHIVIPVPDLVVVAETLAAAGFIVTPQADHPFGTSNRLVVFAATYLEFVAPTRPELLPSSGFAAEVAGFLERRQGVSHIAVSTPDAVAENAILTAAGLAVGPVFEFSRPAPLADGTTAMASFTLAPTRAGEDLGTFLCAHHTPEAVWHASHLDHPNGVRAVTAIELTAPVPKLLDLFDVAGVDFAAPADRIRLDVSAAPVMIGGVEILGSSDHGGPS